MDMLQLFKALADQTRLRLIAILQLGEFTVQELVAIFNMGQSRISRHLKILLDAGVVQVKREGTWAYYQLKPSNRLFAELQPLLSNAWSGLQGYQEDRSALGRVLAERRQRSQQFFDRHARQWDRMTRELLPLPDYRSALLAQLGECGMLLEVGVGTGQLLEELSRCCRSLLGIDHSPSMLEAARERVAEKHLPNVELRLGQMDALPLEAACADVAVMNMVLHHAPDPQKVLAELSRVLRPGGRLLLCDLQSHDQEWLREQLADQWLGFDRNELTDWSAAAGFQVRSIEILAGRETDYPVMLLAAQKPPVVPQQAA